MTRWWHDQVVACLPLLRECPGPQAAPLVDLGQHDGPLGNAHEARLARRRRREGDKLEGGGVVGMEPEHATDVIHKVNDAALRQNSRVAGGSGSNLRIPVV